MTTTASGGGVELLPCPFCGVPKPVVARREQLGGTEFQYVTCIQCGARGPEGMMLAPPSQQEVMTAWNARPALSRGDPVAWMDVKGETARADLVDWFRANYGEKSEVVARFTTPLFTHPSAARVVDEWLPIETAPNDGTLHIRGLHVFRPDGSLVGWQAFCGRMSDDGIDFIDADDQLIGWEPDDYTHWRPLPAPPALEAPNV